MTGKETIEKTPKQMAEAVLIPLDYQVNRNSKDSVFCDLFSDPKYVLELYAALHPEDDISKIEDITLVTLDNQMLRVQYNDLGFIIGNRLLILIEEQSSWSINVLIRILMYLGESYQRYIRNNSLNVYSTKKVPIPQPEFYVIYPKERNGLPKEISLSKDFFRIENPNDSFIDLKVKIIYDSEQGDIINQYVNFCRVFDEQVGLYGRTEKAVNETIRICKDKNVLKEYLQREEIPNIMFGVFDKEYQLNLMLEEERQEARETGRAEGRAEGREEGRAEGQAEGRVMQAIKMYRVLAKYDDAQILDAICNDFNLSAQDAKKYIIMEHNPDIPVIL